MEYEHWDSSHPAAGWMNGTRGPAWLISGEGPLGHHMLPAVGGKRPKELPGVPFMRARVPIMMPPLSRPCYFSELTSDFANREGGELHVAVRMVEEVVAEKRYKGLWDGKDPGLHPEGGPGAGQ